MKTNEQLISSQVGFKTDAPFIKEIPRKIIPGDNFPDKWTFISKKLNNSNNFEFRIEKYGNITCAKETENKELQNNYNHLKKIYEESINLENHVEKFTENCVANVSKCFRIIADYLTNDFIKKIINEKINKHDKIILDCIMIGTSILCEISDDNDEISLKIANDDIIMLILRNLVDELSYEIKPFSIRDQLIENIVFVCLNVSKRFNKTKINEIIAKLKYCINNEDINRVIKVGVALTIAFVGGEDHENIYIIKQLIKSTIDKIKERKEDNWCGFSLNELKQGLEKYHDR